MSASSCLIMRDDGCLRFVDMLDALSSADETRMSGIHQNLGRSALCNIALKVASVQNIGQFGSSVLWVGSKISVELIQALKLDVARSTLMSIGGLVHNPDSSMLFRSLLQKIKKITGQKDMSEVVRRHVLINPIRRELISLNTSRSIVNKDIQSVSRILDLISCLLDFSKVTDIALDPFCAVSFLLTKLFGDGLLGAVNDLFGEGEDDELADVVGEEGVGYTIADSFAATRYDSDFAGEVGGF